MVADYLGLQGIRASAAIALTYFSENNQVSAPKVPDSKFHEANMGSIWGRQDPGGPVLATWTLLSGALIKHSWNR